MGRARAATGTTLLVDGHVHYHDCFGVARFLRAARDNFAAVRKEADAPGAVGCLMFSESAWSHYFRSFGEGQIEREAPGWSVRRLEDCSLAVHGPESEEIVLVAGRQIVTSERLEVLALATTREYPDGMPLREAADLVISTGAIPVVPWGFGKWTMARGRLVEELLHSPLAGSLFLGDNGGRAAPLPTPRLLRVGSRLGIPVLTGSDPLPLRSEAGKPGRCGFVLEGPVDPHAPAAGIRMLLSRRTQPASFGRLEKLGTFLARQAGLRLQRRRGNPALRAGGSPLARATR
jgi:hypothetical protein